MDLSKAFDTLNHRLLLAKLKTYSYSSWSEIIAGVPQGSILIPLLFNIFLNNLFLYPQETFLSNYADDNTLYSIGNTIEGVKKALSNNFNGSKCEEMQ